jgi:hypothetical protein
MSTTIMLCTIWALYADDLRVWTIPKDYDIVIDIILLASIIIFFYELIMSSFVKDGYFLHFFFWLDLVALISMLPDIHFLVNLIDSEG